MYQLHLSGNDHQILWSVWRKTWCWKKKSDWISLTQLEEMTGLSRVAVCRSKKSLVSKKILLEIGKELAFNKNYEEWVVSKPILVSKTAMGSVKKVFGGSVKNDTHNRYSTIDTNTISASRTRLGKTLTLEERERAKLGIFPR